MNAEIIAVGSELLTPGKVDTNSLYLTQHLNDLGIEVVAKSIIGDDRSSLTEQIRKEKILHFTTNAKVRRSDFPSSIR